MSETAFADSRSFPRRPALHSSEVAREVNTAYLGESTSDISRSSAEAGLGMVKDSEQSVGGESCDAVVPCGYESVRTILSKCCGDFCLPLRRRQFAWFDRVVFEHLVHVWSLVSWMNDMSECLCEDTELNWCAIPLIVVGVGESLSVPCVGVAGPSRAAEFVSGKVSSEVTKVPLAESRRLLVTESKLSEYMERKERKKTRKCGER